MTISGAADSDNLTHQRLCYSTLVAYCPSCDRMGRWVQVRACVGEVDHVPSGGFLESQMSFHVRLVSILVGSCSCPVDIAACAPEREKCCTTNALYRCGETFVL